MGAAPFFDVNFDWVERFDDIWRDHSNHIAGVNDHVVTEIIQATRRIQNQTTEMSPLGLMFVGTGGSGKTHLLSTIRQEAIQEGFNYVAVDLTSVNNFWDTILLNYLQALDRPYAQGQAQFKGILERLIQLVMPKFSSTDVLKRLATTDAPQLIPFTTKFIAALGKSYKKEIIHYQDVVRALVYYNSDNMAISDVGYSWLQGMPLNEQLETYQYRQHTPEPMKIVEAISWLMARKGPTILAIDQLDAIVAEHHQSANWRDDEPSDETMKSRAIVESIGGGLSALIDRVTCKTQVVVSCLDATRDCLDKTLATHMDRFQAPMILKPLVHDDLCAKLVTARLNPAYEKVQYTPPYPSFPFSKTALSELKDLFPRDILKECEKFKQHCKTVQRVYELTSFSTMHEPEPLHSTKNWAN
ncbi:MAG: hypothetical protein P8144_03670 [Gammaproteobacteria bacterium]